MFNCSVTQASIYATYLSKYMLASSIISYLSAVVFFHTLEGFKPPYLADCQLRATINGIKNRQAQPKRQKDPILPCHLQAMFGGLNLSSDLHVCVWAAILVCFRALLRVSHVVSSPHLLLDGDVELTEWGMLVTVSSSKTSKSYSAPHRIPLSRVKDKRLCPVYWLERVRARKHPAPTSPAYSTDSVKILTYSSYTRVFKSLLADAGIRGDFATHSLRTGGATLMASTKCTLTQIKNRGQWASDCVFQYLKPTLSDDLEADLKMSKMFK